MQNREAVMALAALAQESRLATFRLLVRVPPDSPPAGLRMPSAFHRRRSRST
jgi:hypothetical protein